jgi:hypothetical protein
MKSALNALPGVEADVPKDQGSRAVALRVVWTGDKSDATRAAVKRRLEETFSDARISV